MDVNLFIPVNVRVKEHLSDSYTITWGLSAAAKSELASAVTVPTLLVYGRNAISSAIEVLGSMPADSTTFTFGVRSGISEVYLTAKLGSVETATSASVNLLSTNIMPEHSSITIGRDENGVSRSIATTADGVVLVTGATINSYGGDASAANQATANTKLDALITATNGVEISTNGVAAQLNNVTLGASTVTALQNATVTNFPANYPDVDALAAINSLKAVAAKEVTLNTVALNTANVLKSTDLSLSGGVLDVETANMPTDFPDLAVLTEIALHRPILEEIANNVIEVETAILAGNIILAENAVNTRNIDVATAAMKVDTAAIAASNTTIANNTLATKLSGDANGVKLDIINATNAQIVKTADLALTAGVLSVTETNPVTDFPDSTSHTLLNNINTSVQGINTNHSITFAESLPAGTNNIGTVNVAQSALPVGAATSSEQAVSNGLIQSSNSILSTIRNTQTAINNTLADISVELAKDCQTVILDEVITTTACTDYRPEAVAIPSELERYSKYLLQIFTYDTQCKLSLYRESAIDGNTYYHKMPSYQAMSTFTQSVFEQELLTARNLMIKIDGVGSFRIRITGFE